MYENYYGDINNFIDFTTDLTKDLFSEQFEMGYKDIYQIGGCYEFAKVLKAYYPEGEFYYSVNKGHCAFFYQGIFYDSMGKITDEETLKTFKIMSEQDHNIASEFEKKLKFELYLRFNALAPFILDEIKKCGISVEQKLTHEEVLMVINKEDLKNNVKK